MTSTNVCDVCACVVLTRVRTNMWCRQEMLVPSVYGAFMYRLCEFVCKCGYTLCRIEYMSTKAFPCMLVSSVYFILLETSRQLRNTPLCVAASYKESETRFGVE